MKVVAHMKSADFQGELTSNGQIAVPPDIAAQVPSGEQLRVTLQWGAPEGEAWRAAGQRRFESAYSEEDSVYEHLIDDTAAR
jgi:hypothetical protein